MKKNFEVISILIVQLLVFYVLPIFAMEHKSSNGMIIIVILATFMLALGIGGISKNRIKYYYPIITALVFIPAIYVYSTEFVLVHTLYLLADAFLGVLIGHVIINK